MTSQTESVEQPPSASIELTKADQEWRASIYEENDGSARTLVRWGKRNGKQQEKRGIFTEGKQGRSPLEQAQLEIAQAARLKIRANGYSVARATLDLDDSPDDDAPHSKRNKRAAAPLGEQADFVSPHPMLASKWEEHEERYDDSHDVYLQPKLDGIRCLANLRTGELWSRQRKRLDRLPWIEEEVRALGAAAPEGMLWLDGELYVHGRDFNDVSHLVRGEDSDRVVALHVYDTVLLEPFSARVMKLQELLGGDNAASPHVVLVPTEAAFKSEVDDALARALAAGYEGLMVRLDEVCKKPDGAGEELHYEVAKRSRALCKYKEFEQEEFEIIELLPQKRNPSVLGAFKLRIADDDATFNASTSGMTAEGQARLWAQRAELVGGIATVKFFERSSKGVPRFPKVLGVRHPDDM